MDLPAQLVQLSETLSQNPEHIAPSTPREILGWFGKYRRTWRQVRTVRQAMNQLKLQTSPDFEGAGFDELVFISALRPTATTATTTTTTTPDPSNIVPASVNSIESAQTEFAPVDPVHRVSRFLSSNPLVAVTRDSTLQTATTQMLMNDYSQLPVMQGERKVDGVISWTSIGKRQVLGSDCANVAHCMEPHFEVKASDSIFSAIQMIKEHDFVLVRSDDQRIVGILTATDISVSFEQISRPFLLLSYIENHLRSIIQLNFDVNDLQAAKDPADTTRIITDVSDMTFGEYIRLLENPDNWSKLGLGLDRKLFVEQINEVRNIRNDVMHFNPEGIEDEDMETLRRVNSFLEFLARGISK